MLVCPDFAYQWSKKRGGGRGGGAITYSVIMFKVAEKWKYTKEK